MVEDEIAFTQRLRAAHPGAKLVLFGHSLGSFMAQDYIERRGDLLDALVLSGTSYRPSLPQLVRASLGRGSRDLNRWLERNKHLAQDITRRQRSPNPHDSRQR